MSRHIDLCDFTQCRLIEERMRYADMRDFIYNGHIIKARYHLLTSEGKMFYKYFIYAHINTTMKQKDAIWDYLNSDEQKYVNRLRNMLNALNVQKKEIML